MAQGSADREQLGGSLLQGVLLALVQEQPRHGYALTTVLERRLGPAWAFSRQSVYKALNRLEDLELISSTPKPGSAHTRAESGQRVYEATARTEEAVVAWMESPVLKEPVRVELQAKIAMSREADAPRLLRALDVYERECFELLRKTNEAEVPMGSWRALAMNLARTAVDEGLQAELRWITLARRWIGDFLAEHRTGGV